MSPVACPFCRQLLPDTRPVEAPDPDAVVATVVAAITHLGSSTARQVAAYLFAPRPAAADVERARRLLDKGVTAGLLQRGDGWDSTLRAVVTYCPPSSV